MKIWLMTLDRTVQIVLSMQHKDSNAECMESNASGKTQIQLISDKTLNSFYVFTNKRLRLLH